MIGSWLTGPRSFAEAAGIEIGYRGQRLGLPATGTNSIAGFGRRLGATMIDWTISTLIVASWHPSENARGLLTLAVFALLNVALVTTIWAGIGGRLLGTRVARLDGANPTLLAVLIRTTLMAAAVPPLVWDRDGRGLHDRSAGCVVVMR
jgi:uncharacterized RDD family membrane protein YckC